MTRWKRRARGSYVAEVGGTRVALVNMKGDGPNSPRWQGPIPSWQVRIGGAGDYDIGSEVKHTASTLSEAKGWVQEHLMEPTTHE